MSWGSTALPSSCRDKLCLACNLLHAPLSSSSAGDKQRALLLQPTAQSVLFSSVAALLGSPGQANYSAANATLDAAAQRAQLQGTPVSSMQWGAWSGGGMASQGRSTALRVQRTGIGLVEPSAGLSALHRLVGAQRRTNWSLVPGGTGPILSHSWAIPPFLGTGPFLKTTNGDKAQSTYLRRSGICAEAEERRPDAVL